MARTHENGPNIDIEAVDLFKLLENYDPYYVFRWLYPSVKPKELSASLMTNKERSVQRRWLDSERDWQPLQAAFRLVDSIACKERAGPPQDSVVREIQQFTGPYFNWAPCACVLALKQLELESQSRAARLLLRRLQKHYCEIFDLASELGSAGFEGFHNWMGCGSKRDINAFQDKLLEFQRGVIIVKTASGAPSRKPVNSYFSQLDCLARQREVGGKPPVDAAEASWIVISGHVSALDSGAWERWRAAIWQRCKHPGIRKIIDAIEKPKRLAERNSLEGLLERYVSGR